MNLLDVFEDRAKTTPDRIFLIEKERVLTFADVFEASCKLASGLVQTGVKPGDRVILGLPNTADFCISLYGIQWAGATAVLVNPRLTAFEVRNAYDLTEPKLVIGEPLNLSLIQSSLKVWSPVELIGIAGKSLAQRSHNDLSAMLLTSGTTGKSKAVMLSHNAIAANAHQLAKRKQLSENDRFLCTSPLFHSNGHTAVLQSMLAAGASIVLLEKFTPEGLLEVTTKFKCTAISGVPTMYQHLINHFVSKPVDLSSLRLCVSGGAPITLALFNEVESRFRAFILEGYGLTETSAGATGNPLEKRKVGTVGLPLDGTEIKISNDLGQELPHGETGEILIRGPQLMNGYYRDQEATYQAITADGFLRSGDLGILDADGYVKILSRKKELIIRSGFNVYPAEVENVVRAIEGIQDVTVVGLPDTLYGEAVHAAVISDLAQNILEERLKKHTGSSLARYKRPTTFSIHKDFPKTGSTKVQKSGVVEKLKTDPTLVKPL